MLVVGLQRKYSSTKLKKKSITGQYPTGYMCRKDRGNTICIKNFCAGISWEANALVIWGTVANGDFI
jgi:hypothetical protein